MAAAPPPPASAVGLLNAWVDFDGDGTWGSGEQVFTDEPLAAGVNSLTFTVPCTASLADTFMRFRLSTAGGDGPTGLALDGEVEDYFITIGNSPPVANAGGPYLVPEGTDSVVLNGLGSSDIQQASASLLYAWDLDDDGSFDDATGFAPTMSGLAGYGGPTTLPIAVRVTDAEGETNTASGTVMIVNVDPTAILLPTPVPPPSGPRRGATPPPPAGEVSFILMIFDFVGDTHTATVDWGDSGGGETLTMAQIPGTAPLTHTYAMSGMFTIVVTVMDLDGGTGVAVKTVTINVGDAGVGGGGPRRSR